MLPGSEKSMASTATCWCTTSVQGWATSDSTASSIPARPRTKSLTTRTRWPMPVPPGAGMLPIEVPPEVVPPPPAERPSPLDVAPAAAPAAAAAAAPPATAPAPMVTVVAPVHFLTNPAGGPTASRDQERPGLAIRMAHATLVGLPRLSTLPARRPRQDARPGGCLPRRRGGPDREHLLRVERQRTPADRDVSQVADGAGTGGPGRQQQAVDRTQLSAIRRPRGSGLCPRLEDLRPV